MSEADRVVMGIRDVSLPLEGVQFPPESVLRPQGPHLLANFLRQAGEGEASRLDDASGSFATAGMAETPAIPGIGGAGGPSPRATRTPPGRRAPAAAASALMNKAPPAPGPAIEAKV